MTDETVLKSLEMWTNFRTLCLFRKMSVVMVIAVISCLNTCVWPDIPTAIKSSVSSRYARVSNCCGSLMVRLDRDLPLAMLF